MGTFGHLAVFSFYPTKNLAALGDAGAIVTDDKEYAGRAQQLRQYGWPQSDPRVSRMLGTNSRMDSMQATILRTRLPLLAAHNARRRQIASLYSTDLVGCNIVLPVPARATEHVYHQYVIRTPHRDEPPGALVVTRGRLRHPLRAAFPRSTRLPRRGAPVRPAPGNGVLVARSAESSNVSRPQ